MAYFFVYSVAYELEFCFDPKVDRRSSFSASVLVRQMFLLNKSPVSQQAGCYH
ncbi:hypothetical protein QUB33_19900 [Microcoleus sp. B3-A4]|uniref:hypothetical protein n=1 Tax=Microcoleus sp. B3-A4 TaxID=2818653 RepID=UPI002FD5FA1D